MRKFGTKTALTVRSEFVLSPGTTAIEADSAAGDGAKSKRWINGRATLRRTRPATAARGRGLPLWFHGPRALIITNDWLETWPRPPAKCVRPPPPRSSQEAQILGPRVKPSWTPRNRAHPPRLLASSKGGRGGLPSQPSSSSLPCWPRG